MQAQVNLSTSIETVIAISERSHTIELKFQVSLEWYEHRAVYHNMKDNNALNVLSQEEKHALWVPYIIFKVHYNKINDLETKKPSIPKNTDENEAITIDAAYSTMFVTKEGGFVRAGLESVDEAEIYQGRDNKITLIQTYSKKFHCTYLLQNFPLYIYLFYA